MASFMQYASAGLGFILASGLLYATYDPVMTFLSYFPTVLYVILGILWVALVMTLGMLIPFKLATE